VRLAGSGAHLLAAEAAALGTVTEVVQESAGVNIAFVAKLGLLADPEITPPRPLYLAGPDIKGPDEAPCQPAGAAGLT
jgi:hypothetical protein